jgi:hypothetical protein
MAAKAIKLDAVRMRNIVNLLRFSNIQNSIPIFDIKSTYNIASVQQYRTVQSTRW